MLTSEVFEKTKFFLTANSRAPEVNLFNKPRISLWPLMRNPAARNAVDRVIAFASTTGRGTAEKPYYFQRTRHRPDRDIPAVHLVRPMTTRGPSKSGVIFVSN